MRVLPRVAYGLVSQFRGQTSKIWLDDTPELALLFQILQANMFAFLGWP
jgi:hypothetical protein